MSDTLEPAAPSPDTAPMEGQDNGSLVQREMPEPDPRRSKLVKRWAERVKSSRKHFEPDFKRMRENTEFVLGAQWITNKPLTGNEEKDDRYVANISLRHVQQATAKLYPQNPEVKFEKREKILTQAWDGDMATLSAAQQSMQIRAQAEAQGVAAPPPDPQTQQILADFQMVQTYDKMINRVGKTLKIMWDYNVDEQPHPFKSMLKMTVRRACITGVGYIKLGFQRAMKMRPDIEARIRDMSERLAHIERISSGIADNEIQMDSPEAEELRVAILGLQQEGQMIVREGLTFDYPDSWAIIPDKKCRSLRGWLGADWVAQEYLLPPEEVEEIYRVDVGQQFTAYAPDGKVASGAGSYRAGGSTDMDDGPDECALCCVWEIYHRKDGLVYTVCDGYPDYLEEPHLPDADTDAFYPWFPVLFNEVYHAKRLFPLSDIDLIRDPQLEINRARQGLREQRFANRPLMATAAGVLEDKDKDAIRLRPPNALVELNGLAPGQKVDDLLQSVKFPPVQPELYDTSGAFEDIMRVLGNQAADLGSTASATATESSIAESSQNTASASIMDDLDDAISQLARAGGQIMLLNISKQTVQEVVGPGAVWPEMDREAIARNVYLQVEAGASGRPNKQQDVAHMVQVVPLLQRIPGISPEWLAREILRRFDDRLDLTDAFVQGVPSMEALNRMPQPGASPGGGGGGGGGPPDAGGPNAPSQQGAQGAQNDQAGPPTNGLTAPRVLDSRETIIQPGQPLGVKPTPGTGAPTP